MKLPQIRIWRERIDTNAVAMNAVRMWGDRPSNGVFILVAWPDNAWPAYKLRESWHDELERRLKARERIIYDWYGPRDWRNHLCDRIRDGHPIEA